MSRYIRTKVGGKRQHVYKYLFGVQESEMHRISLEYGVGEYKWFKHLGYDEETGESILEETSNPRESFTGELHLEENDLPHLKSLVERLEYLDSLWDRDNFFTDMARAILDFAETQVEFPIVLEDEF